MTDPVLKLLDSIDRVKTEMKLKEVFLSEVYLGQVEERQQMKNGIFQKKRLLEQKHEEEVLRIESDILKIKVREWMKLSHEIIF